MLALHYVFFPCQWCYCDVWCVQVSPISRSHIDVHVYILVECYTLWQVKEARSVMFACSAGPARGQNALSDTYIYMYMEIPHQLLRG